MRFLGLDIGTTRMKCGIYNENGVLEYSDSVDYGQKEIGKERYVDIDKVEGIAFKLLEKAYSYFPFSSITITSLGESFVVLDKYDNILYYPMLYTDPRGKEEAESMMDKAEYIFSISGVYPQGMYSAYKLMWIKNNVYGQCYKKADKVMLVNEYISYKLTGKRSIDYSQAARTGVFDIRKKVFSDELCELFGIESKYFSPAVASGEIIGSVKEDILEKWNVNSEIYLIAGGHDQVCAALGAGVTEKNICSDGMGTVECLTAVYENPSENASMGACGYPNVPFLKNYYCTYALNYSCGSLVRWWISNCGLEKDIESGRAFIELEKDFKSEPTDIFVLPYFDGAATPYQNIEAKGGIINLSLYDSKSRIYQAILEGLCFEMKLNLDVIKKFGINPKKMVVTGGGATSEKWLQMKANILGIPVYPLKEKEAGVCGAAMLGVSAMLKENINSVAKRFVKTENPFIPDKIIHKNYMSRYRKYKKLYKALSDFSG